MAREDDLKKKKSILKPQAERKMHAENAWISRPQCPLNAAQVSKFAIFDTRAAGRKRHVNNMLLAPPGCECQKSQISTLATR